MLKQIIAFSLVFPLTITIHIGNTPEAKCIEIFSIEAGKVVKAMPLTPKIKDLSIHYLNNIAGICQKLNPIPSKGIAIKIMFQQPLKMYNKFLPDKNIEELIVMLPKNEPPLLMTFDKKYATSFFYFKGNASLLLQALDYKMK